jgi:arginine decarboxylase
MRSVPKFCQLVSGAGKAETQLEAFDVALLAAGAGDYNLVRVSSIFPPFCKILPSLPGFIAPGSLVSTAFAFITSDTVGEHLAASVAVGTPEDPSLPGVIMEWHGNGTKGLAEDAVVGMVQRAMERRNRQIKDISVIASEWVVTEKSSGAAFAAVLLF